MISKENDDKTRAIKDIKDQLELNKQKFHPESISTSALLETQVINTSESIVSLPVPKSKARRRASSVYILEGTGTSLTRHRVADRPVTPTPVAPQSVETTENQLPPAVPVSSLTSLFLSASDADSGNNDDNGAVQNTFSSFKPFQSTESEPNTVESNCVPFAPPAVAAPVPAPVIESACAAPLFEHFLIVGMPQKVISVRSYKIDY